MFYLLFASFALLASADEDTFKSKVIAALQPIADAYSLYYNTSFSIGVANAENPTGFEVAAGINNHRDGSKATTTSLYPVGSATKLYTAVAVLQAHEKGLIDLDAPVAPVIDPFLKRTNGTTLFDLWQNEAVNVMTARQLLGMRSGLSDYDDAALNAFSLDPATWDHDITPYDYLHRWALKEILFPPGTGGAYTSIGFTVLGFLLAAAHNVTTWQEFDQKSIFPPELRSKLTHMIFHGHGICSANPQITHQYTPIIEQVSTWSAIHFLDMAGSSCSDAWTAGNLMAAPSDMAGAVYNVFGLKPLAPLLTNSSLTEMVEVKPLTTGWSVGLEYGLGCMAVDLYPAPSIIDPKYTQVVGHAGQDYGSGAPLHFYNRAMDVSVVLVMNSEFGMNCSLPDISDNQHYQKISCPIWNAIVTAATNGTEGPLKCQELGERKQTSPPAVHKKRRQLLDGGSLHCGSASTAEVCKGASSALAGGDCFTWKSLHDQFYGQNWKKCNDKWDDPCGCELVKCSDDGTRLVELHLSNNSLYGFVNGSTDISKASSLEKIDVSFNILFGSMPDLTAQLPKLVHLDASYNLFSGALPNMNFDQLTDGCSVVGNDFNCPLPSDAYARCGGEKLKCDSGFFNFTSTVCAEAMLKILENPTIQYWEGVVAAEAGALTNAAGQGCGKQLQANHSCIFALNWTKFRTSLMGYEASLKTVDPTAALCFLDSSKIEYIQSFGEVFIAILKNTAFPFSGVCDAGERGKILEWFTRPSQCVLSATGGNNCVDKFSASSEPICTSAM